MSKAFLRETDHDPDDVVATPVSALPPGAPNYMTAAGLDRLRQELRGLKTIERPALSTRASTDEEARRQLIQLDQRIRVLLQSSLTAEVVSPPPGQADVVRFGARVTVQESGGETAAYRLVGVDEADPAAGDISWVSPLAQALLNHRIGDVVPISTPSGVQDATVVAIRYG